MSRCTIQKCARDHWMDEIRRCATHRVTWHLPWSGDRESRAWGDKPRDEPVLCPVEQCRQLVQVVDGRKT